MDHTNRIDILEESELFSLVNLTKGYRLEDFECEIPEYKEFLCDQALDFQELNIARTYLLIDKRNASIVSYMSLVSDSIKLSNGERETLFPEYIRFSSFPSIKIGKLAVDKVYKVNYGGIGSLMIELARGIAAEINDSVACKFITVDADVEHNPGLTGFYEKNDFVLNESYPHGAGRRTISMRLNIFNETTEEVSEVSA